MASQGMVKQLQIPRKSKPMQHPVGEGYVHPSYEELSEYLQA